MIKRILRLLGTAAAIFLTAALVIVWDGLHDSLHSADYAVVMGNRVEPNGAPSLRLQARLDRTLELYGDGLFPKIIVSGGIGREGYDEAAVMKQYLSAHGIPADCIIEDNQGLTTFATAKNTIRILRDQKRSSVLVVSQYFHISRSVLALHRCGIADVYSAHALCFEWRDLYSIPREVLGYARYLVE